MLKKIDQVIEDALTWATTTKSAFYALNVLILIAVVVSPPTTIQGWLLVIVSEYYQGVALPGLGAATKRSEDTAKRESVESRKLLQETHDNVMRELDDMKKRHALQETMLQELVALHNELYALVKEWGE